MIDFRPWMARLRPLVVPVQFCVYTEGNATSIFVGFFN